MRCAISGTATFTTETSRRKIGHERRGFVPPDDVLHAVSMARKNLGIEKRLNGREQVPAWNVHRHFIWLVSNAAAPPWSLPYFSNAERPPAA